MRRFVMRVEPCRERGNRESRCVRICGAHEKILVQSSFHRFAQTSQIPQYPKHWRDDTYLLQLRPQSEWVAWPWGSVASNLYHMSLLSCVLLLRFLIWVICNHEESEFIQRNVVQYSPFRCSFHWFSQTMKRRRNSARRCSTSGARQCTMKNAIPKGCDR